MKTYTEKQIRDLIEYTKEDRIDWLDDNLDNTSGILRELQTTLYKYDVNVVEEFCDHFLNYLDEIDSIFKD